MPLAKHQIERVIREPMFGYQKSLKFCTENQLGYDHFVILAANMKKYPYMCVQLPYNWNHASERTLEGLL